MQSKTSSSEGRGAAATGALPSSVRPAGGWFQKTLYLKNLARFWPVWVLYTLVWIFILPMNLLTSLRFADPDRVVAFAARDVLYAAQAAAIPAFLFAVLAAMCVFSYLYQSRSVSLYHSLPLRREGLFFTSYLSGFTFLAAPAVLVFFLTLLAEAASGYVDAGALCMWLVVHLLSILFFYSFAVFCAMFTGNLLALPAFYGILNFLAAGVYAVVDALLRQVLYGYDRVYAAEGLSIWLTPVIKFYSVTMVVEEPTVAYESLAQALRDGTTKITFQGLPVALLYGAVGVVLALCALAFYRRRRLESAGDVISVGWVRPVFKYGVGFCSALVGGTLLYWLFSSGRLDPRPLPLLLWMLPCGAVGYFVAEMLLQKSFRVFSRWKGCAMLVMAVAVLAGGVWLDPLGYTEWTPDPAQVKEATVWSLYTYPQDSGNDLLVLTSPEEIALLVQAHASVTREEEAWRAGFDQNNSLAEATATLPDGRSYQYWDQESNNLRLEYQMADGRSVRRNYDIRLTEAQLADPDSYAALLQDLVNRRRETLYRFPDSDDSARLVAGDLTVLDPITMETSSLVLPTEQLEELYAAVRADIDAGRLGVRYLMEDRERLENCYYNDLTLGFYAPDEDQYTTQMYEEKYGPAPTAMERSNRTVTVTLQTTATETLAVLERMGVLDETHVLATQAELSLWRNRVD